MLEIAFNYAWILIQLAIGYNLVLPLLLFLLYFFLKRTSIIEMRHYAGDYAVIVTAFEHIDLLPETVESILNLNYPNYLVYVVADKCDVSNLHFDDPRVILLKPETILASNTRSHLYAFKNFKREHNRVSIIDSDNIVHTEFLNELEKWFAKGFKAVQGYRRAKNLNTTYACLDAARDIYYHFYDGKVLFALGSSATLAGSGMAFTTDIYKSFLENHDIKGAGFDKVLQFDIVRKNQRIAFAECAIVYDEKIAETDQLVNQRSRWINTWFRYFRFGFALISSGIKSFSWNQLLFGIILLRPPLFIFLILSLLFLIVNLVISVTAAIVWAVAIFCFLIGFAFALANSVVDRKIYRSLLGIPQFVFYQVLSLFKIATLSKRSVSTRHSHTSVQHDEKPY
ncbi:glycosyltransferase [Daejeonella sp.]|uniref:glycosyltransferase n=1 Tax=Daejeonella sp. TaxID=2805397 RepID=UPI0030BBFFFF